MDSCSSDGPKGRHGGAPASLEACALTSSDEPACLPRVTVVVPAHNMELYVERALGSAVNQTYCNLDILVIDDGSTDRTPEIVERFARAYRNVRVITSANCGVAAARNRGLELARTPYVAFLDADDLWAPRKIEKQINALNNHGHSGDWVACYTLYRMIDESDTIIDNGPSSEERGAFFDSHLEWNHVGNGSSLLVSRDAALAVGGFNSAFEPCEDFEFQLKLLRRYKMELVREYEVGYRIHSAQASRDVLRMRLSRVAVIDHIAETMKLPANKRDRLLAQSYLMIAQSHISARDWGSAMRFMAAAVSLSPSESAIRIKRRLGRDLRHFWSRVTKGSRRDPVRSFLQIDSTDDLDTMSALSAQEFGPVHAAARARSRSATG